jgi:hypothetical protein
MAKQNLADATGLSPSPLKDLAPGVLSNLTAEQRAKKLKRTTKKPKLAPTLVSKLIAPP